MKRTLPLLIAAVTGFVLIGAHFVPYTQSWGEEAMIWFDILAAIAFILGGANLVKLNLQKISDRRAGWGYAAVTVIAFFLTLVVGMAKARMDALAVEVEAAPEAAAGVAAEAVPESAAAEDSAGGQAGTGVLPLVLHGDAAFAGHERISETAFDLALHVAAYAPPFLTPDNVTGDYLAEQEAIFRKQAELLDKPARVVDGIVKGKLRKHLQEICLLEQAFVKDQKLSVKQLVAGLGKELGTEVQIADYVYYKVGEEAPAAG